MANNLALPYHPQLSDGYCLAACAQMVLAYFGVTRTQAELAHWQGRQAQHAVVVVGIEAAHISILDPALLPAPIVVGHDEFLLAWEEMDCRCGVIVPRKQHHA